MKEAAAGALLGVVAQELYRATVVAVKRATSFRHELKLLESTLRTVTPKIDHIDQLTSKIRNTFPKDLLAEIQMFKRLLIRGKELVITCSEIPRWRIWKKYRYTKKIRTLNESLGNLVRIQLPAVKLDLILLGVLSQLNKMNENLLRKDIQHEFSSIPNSTNIKQGPSPKDETTYQSKIHSINCCNMYCSSAPACMGRHPH